MMRWFVGGVIAVIVIIAMYASSILFVASGGASASCRPSTTAIEEGSVTVGSGPASDAYFDHFGSSKVLEKKANAALMIQLSRQADLSERSTAIVIATSLQEAGLINLPYGDEDSMGLFQQRPSMIKWGTAQEVIDPVHATNTFIEEMKRLVPNRDSMPMIEVAIAVQIPSVSAYYSSWVWDDVATELVKGASEQSCAEGEARLPLDPGYQVSGSWGSADPTYPSELKPHKGIDLADYADGSAGKPVYAALSGVVIESGIGQGCSGVNTVTILHDEGFSTGYLHMDGRDISVRVGDHVVAGQQVGRIASCGPSTGAHLHFEVNPRDDESSWLKAIPRVSKYGSSWSDPVAVMAHFGIDLTP